MLRIKNVAVAAVAVLCVSGGAASATQSVYIQSAGIYNPGTIDLTTARGTENVYTSDVIFRANMGTASASPAFDLIGFCVDIYHNISVGINGQGAEGLHYHTARLLTDSNGQALTSQQRSEIGGLAARGVAIQQGNASDKYADLAAIQGAIWTIEYPAATVTASGGYSDLQTRINGYVAQAPSLRGPTPYAIYADGGATQGFIVNTPPGFSVAVPEPASWALLIAGFGMVGLTARRRRTMRPVAA